MNKRELVYIYPNKSNNIPYIINLRECLGEFFDVYEENDSREPHSIDLLKSALKANCYILNWIENVGFLSFGTIQFIIALLSLWIIRVRNKKLVWIFHNIHPHMGDNWKSRTIQHFLFKKSDFIVGHSKEAVQYAKSKIGNNVEIAYVCHPILKRSYKAEKINNPKDILFWGNIFRYKGVVEFIQYIKGKPQHPSFCICGKCEEDGLEEEILNYCDDTIEFNNGYISFERLTGYINQSKFVIFPYLGESISSSGALMDTIMLGGNVVGPNRGAFKDLSEEGVCFVYDNYDEMYDLLTSTKSVNDNIRLAFIQKNSWESFGLYLKTKIC